MAGPAEAGASAFVPAGLRRDKSLLGNDAVPDGAGRQRSKVRGGDYRNLSAVS